MPDENDNDTAEAEDLPQTSLHAHDDGREEDVEGDPSPEVREDGDLDRQPGDDDANPPGNPAAQDKEPNALPAREGRGRRGSGQRTDLRFHGAQQWSRAQELFYLRQLGSKPPIGSRTADHFS